VENTEKGNSFYDTDDVAAGQSAAAFLLSDFSQEMFFYVYSV
jgi:hypothetical protein